MNNGEHDTLTQSNTMNHSMDESEEETTVEHRDENCKSPTEARYGDDELAEIDEESDDTRPKRRSRRIAKLESTEDDSEEQKPIKPFRRQSSSEDEVMKSRNRAASGDSVGRRRVPSSSEDDVISPTRRRVSSSRKSISERKSSFEQSTTDKRSSFSSRKANTVATSGDMERKRESFSKTRAASVENSNPPPRKSSEEKPEWSSSTKVDHERVLTHTIDRKGSTTHSESDNEPKSASQLKAKWESRATGGEKQRRESRTRAFGGSTGAAAMRARFENSSTNAYKRRTSSASDNKNRSFSQTSVDGEPTTSRTASSIKAKFEAKNNDTNVTSAPVKRNFVINKGKAGGLAKKFGAAATSNKCTTCSKTVYPMEKLEANGEVYHKFCFRCLTCNRTVGLGNYAALQGKIYCKPHLKQLFKLKGNYDEGFGRPQRKADWVKTDESQESSNPSAAESDGNVIDETNAINGDVVVNGNNSDGEE